MVVETLKPKPSLIGHQFILFPLYNMVGIMVLIFSLKAIVKINGAGGKACETAHAYGAFLHSLLSLLLVLLSPSL